MSFLDPDQPRRIPTPEQVAARRAELLRILAIEEPDGKYWYAGKRKAWHEQQAEAKAQLRSLDRGTWEPPNEDDIPY